MNNIITVDGLQVAIIDKRGVVLKHEINQWKREFSEEFWISYDGIGCVYRKPEKGLKLWKPK